jgi:hypothetical protein
MYGNVYILREEECIKGNMIVILKIIMFSVTVLFLMAKAWQECNRPPESSLRSLMSSSQGWSDGPPAIS